MKVLKMEVLKMEILKRQAVNIGILIKSLYEQIQSFESSNLQRFQMIGMFPGSNEGSTRRTFDSLLLFDRQL